MFVNEKELNEEFSDKSLTVKPQSTFIIVDWDDTLLPTSWLTKNGFSLDTMFIPERVQGELDKIDDTVVTFLRKTSVLYGKILIITNAQKDWIRLSSKKFLPQTYEILYQNENTQEDSQSICSFSSSSSGFHDQQDGNQRKKRKGNSNQSIIETPRLNTQNESAIQVYSARHMFEKDHPNDPSSWKKTAFGKILKPKIDEKFFSWHIEKNENRKSMSEGNNSDVEILNFPEKRGVKRSLSSLSLSTLDVNSFIELESETIEEVTDFKDTDSFFSIDFGSDLIGKEGIQIEWNGSSDFLEGSDKYTEALKRETCNLVSIGDCFHDCESLTKLNIGLDPSVTLMKTVKLIDFPSISQLFDELLYIVSKIDKIVKHCGNCNLTVDKKKLNY